MEEYIQQLIEDFRESAKKVPAPGPFWENHKDETSESGLEDLAFVNQYVNGMPQKLSVIFGIDKVVLPPLEKLKSYQAACLYNEMLKLWHSYNFFPDFPKKLPPHLRYKFLRDYWESEQILVDKGEIHVEFCQYEPDLCPFPCKYCDCKDFDTYEGKLDENWENDGEAPL
ncbi:hypothetical protein [Pleomorphovibrio marinus]|uniref:hypothetical protein n=1 Tax=Pleomorphovibrio marinus TaxID=2164132 RepID=UPI000E0AC39E|nr:hypothetical protein [Pleomorphovibrio marinus]